MPERTACAAGPGAAFLARHPLVLWRADAGGRVVEGDPGRLGALGLPCSRIGDWLRRVHPADAPAVRGALARSAADGADFDAEARVRQRRGGHRWVRVRAAPERDAAGTPCGWLGAAEDAHEAREALEELRDSERNHRLSMELNPQQLWIADPEGHVTVIGPGWRRNLRVEREEMAGQSWRPFMHPDDAEEVLRLWLGALRSGEPFDHESRFLNPDAGYRWVRSRAAPQRDAQGRILRWYGSTEDVHDRRVVEERLRASEARLAAVLSSTTDFVRFVDRDWRVVYLNRVLGRSGSAEDYQGQELWTLHPYLLGTPAEAALRQAMDERRPARFDLFLDHARAWMDVRVFPGADGLAIFAQDVTEQRRAERERDRAEARLAHLARHDALTGLANRVRLAEAMASPDAGRRALLYLDLDGFKAINDGLGHAAGDALLREVAARLRDCVGGDGLVARLGGDEFVVLMHGLRDPRAPEALAERLIGVVGGSPFALAPPGEGGVVQARIGVSVGIALDPDGAPLSSDRLLGAADAALYGVKAEGRGTWRVFEPAARQRVRARQAIRHHLHGALGRGELSLAFQPMVSPRTGRARAAEALLRWHHPELGPVSPAEFVPVAEEGGLIGPIGAWVLEEACRAAAAWPALHRVCVNLSAAQFRDGDLVALVADCLERSGLPASRLELEITEAVLLRDSEANLCVLHALRRAGVGIALDDFGTGHSSLSYLRRFPVSRIKIDRSFVRGLPADRGDGAIVRALLGLARTLGVAVTAEGVETEAQLDWLRREGCGEVQGFLTGRPMPPDALTVLLAGRHEAVAGGTGPRDATQGGRTDAGPPGLSSTLPAALPGAPAAPARSRRRD